MGLPSYTDDEMESIVEEDIEEGKDNGGSEARGSDEESDEDIGEGNDEGASEAQSFDAQIIEDSEPYVYEVDSKSGDEDQNLFNCRSPTYESTVMTCF